MIYFLKGKNITIIWIFDVVILQNKLKTSVNMKKSSILNLFFAVLIMLGCSNLSYAQLGVNTDGANPDASSMLDIKSTNKGILLPRVALTGTTDAVTVPTPAVSLIVYNTATAGDVTPGYYYNSGTTGSPVWSRFAIGTSSITGTGTATRVAFWNSPTNLSSNANLYWDNTNARLGIGTATPFWPLQVKTSSNTTDWLGSFENGTTKTYLSNGVGSGIYVNSANTDPLKYALSLFNGTSNLFFVSNGGNVGIGTTAPGNNLEISGSTGLRISDPANIYRGKIIFGSSNAWNAGINSYDNGFAEFRIWAKNSQGQIVLATGYDGETSTTMPTDGLFINQNKVGIGTTTPGYKLDVNGNIGTNYGSLILNPSGGTVDTDGTYGVYWHQISGTPDASFGIYRTAGAWNSPNYQQLKLSFATGIIIDGGTGYGRSGTFLQPSGGNVGIGTTTPAFKLHVPSGSIGTDYINTTDNSVSSGVTGVMVKCSDDYHRTATSGALATFLDGNWIRNNGDGDWQIASSSTGLNFATASLELRESNFSGAGGTNPRISFHHGGMVASQIGMENSGRIAILNNPGTAYESLVAADITGNEMHTAGWFRNSEGSKGLYNVSLVNHFAAITDADWFITGSTGACGLAFGSSDFSTKWGYFYADGSGVGILNNSRSCALMNPAGTTNIQVVGNLGIGTATPVYPLTVVANTTSNAASLTNGPTTVSLCHGSGYGATIATSNGDSDKYGLYVSNGAGVGLAVFNDGKMSIGTYSTTQKIYVYGGAYCTGTTWTDASDRRLKNSIKPMTHYGLSEILKLEPVTYYYNTDSVKSHKEIGFIAQDVLKIVPEVVSGKEGDIIKGETLGLSYGNLVPVLVNAIKEQQTTITNQQTLINNQQSSINAQQAQIDELKKMVDILLKK